MKKLSLLFVSMALITFVSCKNKNNPDKLNDSDVTETEMQEHEQEALESDEGKTVHVQMDAKSDSNVQGEVSFTQEGNGKVKLEAAFSGLNPDKKHAIHLHENADCSADDASSAGGHWNPTDDQHGKWKDSDGYHLGDIGNLKADENGNATISFETDKWCIDCDDSDKNIVGRSVVLHADEDDFKSQPAGDAGDRISCGEIKN